MGPPMMCVYRQSQEPGCQRAFYVDLYPSCCRNAGRFVRSWVGRSISEELSIILAYVTVEMCGYGYSQEPGCARV